MNFEKKKNCISDKLKNYREEISGLTGASILYQICFGFLLIILFPVLLLEMAFVLLIGKDFGIFVLTEPVEPPELIDEEVPESLRDLIALARKFGVGDDAIRGDIMKACSTSELKEMEEKVLPRQQEISDWLDTFPETEIPDTASFFLYLGSACDEVPLYKIKNTT